MVRNEAINVKGSSFSRKSECLCRSLVVGFSGSDEWSLSESSFRQIESRWEMEIDLFAAAWNSVVSWQPQPEAWANLVLVTPYWPCQVWFLLAQDLASDTPIILTPVDRHLTPAISDIHILDQSSSLILVARNSQAMLRRSGSFEGSGATFAGRKPSVHINFLRGRVEMLL